MLIISCRLEKEQKIEKFQLHYDAVTRKIKLRDRLQQLSEIFSLAILERLKACYDSNNYGGTPRNSIFMF